MERHALLKISALSFGKCFQSTIARQVITTPLKSNPKTRNKLVNHQKEQLFEKSYRGNTKTCIVACKNSSLNHFFGQTYGWIPAGINYSCIKLIANLSDLLGNLVVFHLRLKTGITDVQMVITLSLTVMDQILPYQLTVVALTPSNLITYWLRR